MHAQKLDFALKRLEKTLQIRLEKEKQKSEQRVNELVLKIAQVQKKADQRQNEIRMLKSIIKETVSTLDELMDQIQKLRHE